VFKTLSGNRVAFGLFVVGLQRTKCCSTARAPPASRALQGIVDRTVLAQQHVTRGALFEHDLTVINTPSCSS
jgi:hypothetical protein